VPRRPVAILLVQQWVLAAALLVITAALTAAAFEGEAPGLRVIDIALLALIALWMSRVTLSLRDRMEAASPLPDGARMDPARKTALLAVPLTALFATLAATADYTPAAEPVACGLLTLALLWQAQVVRRFERATGRRVYRERRIFERGGACFYSRSS